MPTITLPDGSNRTFADGVDGLAVARSIGARLERDAVAIRVNGELRDLTLPIESDAKIEIVTRTSPDGLELLRHDAAHVMAEAVKELYPETQVTIGPAIEDGFYYDFDKPGGGFTDDDLKKIEKTIKEIVKSNTPFRREVVSRNEALSLFEKMGETFKVEIIKAIPEGEEISLYKHGKHEKSQDPKNEWVDVCEHRSAEPAPAYSSSSS